MDPRRLRLRRRIRRATARRDLTQREPGGDGADPRPVRPRARTTPLLPSPPTPQARHRPLLNRHPTQPESVQLDGDRRDITDLCRECAWARVRRPCRQFGPVGCGMSTTTSASSCARLGRPPVHRLASSSRQGVANERKRAFQVSLRTTNQDAFTLSVVDVLLCVHLDPRIRFERFRLQTR